MAQKHNFLVLFSFILFTGPFRLSSYRLVSDQQRGAPAFKTSFVALSVLVREKVLNTMSVSESGPRSYLCLAVGGLDTRLPQNLLSIVYHRHLTSAQVVETSVTVTDDSPFQEYPDQDDLTTRSTVTPDTTCLVYLLANYLSIVSVCGIVTSRSLYI